MTPREATWGRIDQHMKVSVSMTPQSYLAHLQALMADGRQQDALDFSVAARSEVQPPLSLEERERVFGMMEVAATMVRLAEGAPAPRDRYTA